MIDLKIKKLDKNAIIPKAVHGMTEDAGLDLHSIEQKTLMQGEFALIKTGISIELPVGCMGKVAPRSGLAYKYGVTVLNAEGTIDPSYRGDVGVILINHGKEPYTVRRGDRIAQLIIQKYEMVNILESSNLNNSKRADSGFGDSGK